MNSLLTRFESQSASRSMILVLLWVLLQFSLLLQFNDLYWADTLPFNYSPFVGIAVFACAVFEIVVLATLVGLAKGFALSQPRYLGIPLFLLLLAPAYFYFLTIIVSWSLFGLGIGFLDIDMLRAFFIDVAAVWKHFTHYEMLIACAALVGPFLPIAVLIVLSPQRRLVTVFKPLLVAGAALALAVTALALAPRSFSSNDRSVFRAFVGRQLLPNLTLYWSGLLPEEREAPLLNLAQELIPLKTIPFLKKNQQPNIVLIIVEALRSDMVTEKIGENFVMPNVNRLASEGSFVENVLAQSAESAYSMTSIITGLYSMKYGSRDTFSNIAYPFQRIYDVLSSAGYETGFFSSANENWQNMNVITHSPGLNTFFDSNSSADPQIFSEEDSGFKNALRDGRLKTGKIDDTITFERLSAWIKHDFNRPYFATLSLQASHFPYEQGDHIKKIFRPSDLKPADEGELSFFSYPQRLASIMRNRYRNSLHYVDGLIGDFVAKLKNGKDFQNTIVIVTGDHGELFHEYGFVTHGASLHNLALAVPFVVYQSGVSHSFRPEQHSLIDVAPTVAELAGLERQPAFQGISMLRTENGAGKRPLFMSLEGVTIKDAVVFEGKKLIFDRRSESYEMYDIANDWNETHKIPSPNAFESCLKKLLANFRARQLTYYKSFALYSKYFPPRHETIPGECSTP